MKLYLINPPFNIVRDGKGSSTTKTNYGYWPPLGLGYIAGSVKAAGYEVDILDAAVLDLSSNEILDRIEKFNPDVIALTTVLAAKGSSVSLLNEIKSRFNIPVFIGGPMATSFPEKTLRENPNVDFLIMGEAENTVVEVLNSMKNGTGLDGIKGVCFRRNGEVVRNEKRESVKDLDVFPSPLWELFDFSLYRPLPLQYKKLPIASYLTSRGCPYGRCTFCYQSGKSAPKYARHSPERVISDIKLLKEKYGIKEISFWDDIFLINRAWIKRFCELWKQEKIDLPWQCYGYVKFITPEILKDISEIGCYSIFYGIESGNQEVLNNVKKGFTVQEIKNAMKWTNELGIDTRCSFVLGLPGDNEERALETIKLAKEINPTYVQFHVLFPEEGTEIWETAKNEGVIVDEYKGRAYAQYLTGGYKSYDSLNNMSKKAYRMFYFRPRYVLKHMKRLSSWSNVKNYFDAFNFIKGLAFKK